MTTIDESFDDILNDLSKMRLGITVMYNKVKRLEEVYNKEMKKTKTMYEKKKRKTKKPSGFAKPSTISPELSQFMDKPVGEMAARTEVTQYIIKYIKERSLQNNENKSEIIPDNKLANLLQCGEEPVTYFTIQKFMNKHFQ